MMDNMVYLIMWGSLVLAFAALLGEAEERTKYWRDKYDALHVKQFVKKLPKGKKNGNAYEKRLYAIGKGRK